MSRLPLAGVRIVDFTWAWAGPQATLLLGMLGAEIIKIESRARLDHTRLRSLMAGPTLASPDHSVIFAELNVNKLSLTLNLTHAEAAEIIKRLVKISDVVAENMRPGVLDRLGIGYEALRAVKPDIIMLSSSAVGNTGPERTYVGYAPTFAALGGIAHISGPPEGPPSPLSGAIDLRVGTTSAFAILAALYHRARTGQGQYIDLSSTETISAMIGDTFMEYAMNRRSPGRAGNRDRTMAPHNCYPCAEHDRWVTIAVATDDEWRALRTVIADPRLEDERFSDGYGRWLHQDELDQIIGEWTATRSPEEITQSPPGGRRGRHARPQRPLPGGGPPAPRARSHGVGGTPPQRPAADVRAALALLQDAGRHPPAGAAPGPAQPLRPARSPGHVGRGDPAARGRRSRLLAAPPQVGALLAAPTSEPRCNEPRLIHVYTVCVASSGCADASCSEN